ncbi:MAG: rhodanese-like domain-containing protein, partial [Psychrilyobacter sp.]|uniref:rhodanese-like domain-containing protein n=1 Tax=Psychrilyobacter sp. TaxID=2586924 RepID=UPI003C735F0A
LDKTKTIYVHCRTGERSYNMTLMLQAKGYDVKNIAGSYEFVKMYEEVSCYNDKTREKIMIGDCVGCCATLENTKF